MMDSKQLKRISLFSLSLCFLLLPLSMDSAEAKRLHDPNVQARVDLAPSLDQGKSKTLSNEKPVYQSDFQKRIHDILNPPAENQTTLFSVPKTASSDDESILGTPLATQRQCVRYLIQNNPNPRISVSPEELVAYYYEEGGREGVRPDVAFVQALKETGFFRYGGTVTPDQNNYCGLGTTNTYTKGAYFPSSLIGVRAHIQHLLAYATTRRPIEAVVDPRFYLVREAYGARTLSRWEDLDGRWAVPGYSYGRSILSMYKMLLKQ